MYLCSMTSMFFYHRGNAEKYTVEESLIRHKQLGFTAFDLNMCAMQRNESEFNLPNWKERAYQIRETAEREGLRFVQSHLPFRSGSFHPDNPSEIEALDEYTRRAVEISAIVGAKWAVLHPVHDPAWPADAVDKQIRYNQKYYSDIVSLANARGVGIALENLTDWGTKRRFGSSASELQALINSYDSSLVGACWDFGHANLTYGAVQAAAIRQLGSAIKACHFADNHGSSDDHVAPFLGMIDWEKIMAVLKEIHYDGPLVLEVMQNNNLPDELKNSSMAFLQDISNYLMKLYNNV